MYSEYLTSKYMMYRRMRNAATVNRCYDNITNMLKDVVPKSTIAVYTPENKKEQINNTWYGRLVYPEQILSCDKMWIVGHDWYNVNFYTVCNPKMYQPSDGGLPAVDPKDYITQSENSLTVISGDDDLLFFTASLKLQPVEKSELVHYSCAFFLEDVAYLFAESLEVTLKEKNNEYQ